MATGGDDICCMFEGLTVQWDGYRVRWQLLYVTGINSAVRWLQGEMTSVAGDREEDDHNEPIALVPILEEQENAMDNITFHSLLRKLGIKEPANEQVCMQSTSAICFHNWYI